ncbi:TetR/AcrR family transcriptional regulator C-terminal domain-containing protein [Actinomycetospora soli]|uniref:TetR/AcrR family transcriptional regulator C-terminal domain-containing protein n=1 Tax=Actinomycetospora soli TaxID=2893887 RepID=UPI001E469018|nr:TetR/AcrR family transcriptional regulator C-terminal domain-containing protein [Actinomycetospora soli]MCD2191692.1 TetR/AcrR family transcriptional regulator C-terminal domain-containing protein [Actinomycetospora soli]
MRISRDQVVETALDLVDDVGVDALTMRALARRLGVQNGATYWHLRSKRALLDAMAEHILAAGTGHPATAAAWSEQLLELAIRFHRVLLTRRDGARIVAGSIAAGPHALARGEAMIAIMRAAGVDDRTAAWAQDALTHLVVGHAIEQQAVGEIDRPAAVAALRAATATGAFPNLAEVEAYIPAPHPPQHLELCLRMLIDGLAMRCSPSDTPTTGIPAEG